MEITVETFGELDDFLETIPSKATRKSYMNGIAKMEEHLGHSILKLLKFPNVSRKLKSSISGLKKRKVILKTHVET